MSALLHRYWLSLLKWGAIVGGVLLVLLRVRHGGKQAEKMEQLEIRHEARTESLSKASQATNRANRVSDPVKRMREYWMRD